MKEEDLKKDKDIFELLKSNRNRQAVNLAIDKSFLAGQLASQERCLNMIEELPNPYPTDIFPEISHLDYIKIHQMLLSKFNISLDRVSADLMRRARKTMKEELTQKIKNGDEE